MRTTADVKGSCWLAEIPSRITPIRSVGFDVDKKCDIVGLRLKMFTDKAKFRL